MTDGVNESGSRRVAAPGKCLVCNDGPAKRASLDAGELEKF
ncbi:MAG TPA: hypothetical protein VF950_05905 [Planctomycetota bacterium]